MERGTAMTLSELVNEILGANKFSDVVIQVDINVDGTDHRTYRLNIEEVDTHTFGAVTIKTNEVEI